jgi:hypothetical protein
MDNEDLPVKKGRLIILVPENLISNMELVNKIYQMATIEQRDIFYLALVDGDANKLAATRSMATLKALVSEGGFHSGSQVEETAHWLEALCDVYRAGDIIVCFTEQQVHSGFMRAIPVSEYLQTRFQAPVRVLSGYYHPARIQISRWAVQLAYWAGLIAILASFFLLEVQLDQAIHGISHTVLLVILLGVEIGAGIAWGKIVS